MTKQVGGDFISASLVGHPFTELSQTVNYDDKIRIWYDNAYAKNLTVYTARGRNRKLTKKNKLKNKNRLIQKSVKSVRKKSVKTVKGGKDLQNK